MKDAFILELEGEAKERYIKRLVNCLSAENIQFFALPTYINTLQMFAYNFKWGVYKKLDQDLNTGFPTPTCLFGLATKKESIEEKVDDLFAKFSRVVEWANGNKLGIEGPKLHLCEKFTSNSKIEVLRSALIQLMKEKIYSFTPKQEAMLKTLGEYYKDEQEFFRELGFLETLLGQRVIGSKCLQQIHAVPTDFIYSKSRDDIFIWKINLFGQFVSMPLGYSLGIATNKAKANISSFFSNDALDRLFGHSPDDIFKAIMGKKKVEPKSVTRISFGPFYDENTTIKGKTQEIIADIGEGYSLEVTKEELKRGDNSYFCGGLFSKPEIVKSKEEGLIKICSPNLEKVLKEEFPEAEVIVAME